MSSKAKTIPANSRADLSAYEKLRSFSEDELFDVVDYVPAAGERTGYSDYSYWRCVFQNFAKNKVAMVLFIVFVILFIFTFVAGHIGNYAYDEIKPDNTQILIAPNSQYWFGTDNLGRDYWCQVWYAAQTSIKLAAVVAVGEIVLGVIIGLLWGYVRQLDAFFTGLYNTINNIPTIIYMTLIALLVGRSFTIMALSLIFFGWLVTARNIRNMVLIYRDREYNLASRCLGTGTFTILHRNILPYMISVIIMRLTLSIPGTIAWESTLSYLGLGLDASTPSLGVLLRNARSYFIDFPYLLIFPAVIVSLITITFYLFGNAFADASDPRNHV